MKPKSKQQLKEEEAQRLAEELKKKEEEDLLALEEAKKYLIVTLNTQLQLTFTDYYLEQAMAAEDCHAFTLEYVTQVLFNAGCLGNFRTIDLQNLVDEVVNDLMFARISMNWSPSKSQVFINILYELYKYQNVRFVRTPTTTTPPEQPAPTNKRRTTTATVVVVVKSRDGDWAMLRQMCASHSSDGQTSQKYFSSMELHDILDYARKSYFAHHSLMQFASRNSQRPMEIVLTLQVEKPTLSPSLAAAFNYIPIKKRVSKVHLTERTNLDEGDDQDDPEKAQVEHIPTDEELLEPDVLAMLQEKLQAVKDQLGAKLESRQLELNVRIEDLQNVGKKGAKK